MSVSQRVQAIRKELDKKWTFVEARKALRAIRILTASGCWDKTPEWVADIHRAFGDVNASTAVSIANDRILEAYEARIQELGNALLDLSGQFQTKEDIQRIALPGSRCEELEALLQELRGIGPRK